MEAFLTVQNWVLCCLLLWSMTLFKVGASATVLEAVLSNSPSLLNVVVDDIHAFAVNNNMRLNPRKCKSVTVDLLHYNGWVPHPIAVVGSDIEQISTFKLLGVHLSEDLTWAVHCDYIVKKANRRLYAMRQLQEVKSYVGWYCSYLLPANSLYTRVRLRCLCWFA